MFALSGCSTKALDWVGGSSSSISGSVVPFGGALNVRALAPTLTCPGATASLIEISQLGETILPALQTVPVADDGTYTFTGLRSLGVSVKQQSLAKPYLVEINGCNLNYGRVLTATKAQDITFGTSLVAYMLNTPNAANIAGASAAKLENLYSALKNYNSFADAYSALSSNTPLIMDFQEALTVNPDVLEDAFPKALVITAPASLREQEVSAFTINSSQWNTNYNYAYSWSMDGVEFSTLASATYTPRGNAQGSHVLTLRLGQQDGGGALDLTKPFQTKTYPVTVANNVLPTPPALSAISANVNTPSAMLRIGTGAALINCDSFSKLAITEDGAPPPLTPGEFSISCSTSPSQTVPFLLQNGLGLRTLYLWAIDSAGVISANPSSFVVNYSLITPVITIASPIANYPTQGTVIVSGTCEDSSGDVSFSGNISPSSSVVACASGTYSKSITLTSGDGTKSITASQTNEFNTTGSASVSVVKDSTAPTVLISSTSAVISNSTAINISATFSEPVTTFTAAKIVAANSAVSAFAGSGTTYTFTLTPSAQGAYSIDIPANVGIDAAGNGNVAASTFSRTFDSSAPSVVLSSAVPSITNSSDLLITATFSEVVSNFSLSGLQLTNASASLLTGGGSTYTFHLAPGGQGAVAVAVAANAAQDAAGNGNTASASLPRTFDSVAPLLTLTSAAADPTNVAPIPVTATFSEAVSGFTLGDIAVVNGSTAGLAGSGSSYTFNVTPSSNGPVSINVASNAAQDAAGNASAAHSLSRVFNNVRPSVTLASIRTSPSRLSPFPITATFSDTVTGLASGDLSITNGTASAVAGSGSAYTFSVTPTGQGDVSIQVNDSAAQDGALNTSLASNSLVIAFDTVAPTLAFTAPLASSYVNLANQAALSVTGACSENSATVALAVGTVTGTATCTANTFAATLNLSSLADGFLSLTANLTDAAGNVATPATVSLIKDITSPTATFTGAPSTASNALTLNVTVSGTNATAYMFKAGASAATDCSVASGYSPETPVSSPITASISALADGNVKLCAVARNAAGNYQPYASATSASWVKDTSVAPFSGLAITPLSPGNSSTPSVSGSTEASSNVKLYSAPSCGGSLLATSAATGAGSFSITPGTSIGVDGSYSLSVQTTDPAGNLLCSTAIPYVLDTAQPLVTISSTAPISTNTATIPVSISFSESVTGFSLAGITVTNGVASVLSGAGASYTFTITPTAQGAVTARIPAGVATDVAGNTNPASLTLTRTFDTVQPNLTLATPLASASVNNTSVTASGACETGLAVDISGSGILSPSSTPCNSSAFSVALSLTSGDGIKNMAFAQTDAAGNTTNLTRVVTLDTVAPNFIFTSIAIQNQTTNTNFVTFGGSCETGVSIAVSGTDTNTVSCTGAAWSYTTASKTSDATRGYTFRQTDQAGNATTIVGSWIRDIVPPTLTLTSPAANFASQSNITLTGSCEIGVPVKATGTGLLSDYNSITCSAGSYSQTVFLSPGDGAKSVTVSQTDAAGNPSSITRSFVRDTIAPALTQTLRSLPYYTNTNSAQFGGSCETGLPVFVTGTDSTSVTCASGSWTYTVATQTTDSSRSYIFTQTDAAGNQGQISATWIRDMVAPTLTLTSSSSFVTSGNSVTFSGACESGLTINVSNAQTSSVACSGGTWSYSTNQGSDGNYSYSFTESDPAGNSVSVNGTWVRSTTGPVITIAQNPTQVTNGSSLVISGTCSGGTAGSNGVITITGSYSGTTACSSSNSTIGNWSYTAMAGSDGTYNYNFSATDNFTTPRTSNAAISWTRDATIPVISNGSFSINGGAGTTPVSYNPVSFSATDNLSTITKFCLKSSNAVPAGSDSCWTSLASVSAIPSNSISVTNYSYNIGIIPQAYAIYLWVMDGAGNISTNANSTGRDSLGITLAPIAPPAVGTVLVSYSDTMNGAASEHTIPAGSDVYIRWTASGSNLSLTPVSIFFTTDDITYNPVVTDQANGQNNCGSVAGSGSASIAASGCYKWPSGSPSSGYYKVRVSLTNSVNSTSFANSAPINSGNIRILAGNTEPGINGAAAVASFQGDNYPPNVPDAQNFAVDSKGILYFRDISNGILTVNPADGKVKQLIASGGTIAGQGDGGPISNAKLVYPVSLTVDFKDRLIIYDNDRIRQIDFTSSPPTISTIIGGGASTGDSVAVAKNLQIANYKTSYSSNYYTLAVGSTPLRVLPNGDIYFYSENYYQTSKKRIRVYNAASGAISSINLTGTASQSSLTWTLGSCGNNNFDLAYDTSSSSITGFYAAFQTVVATSAPCNGGSSTVTSARFAFSPTTGLVQTPAALSPTGESSSFAIEAHDGKMYRIDKQSFKVLSYNSATDAWSVILGTGTGGSCVDGTAATACKISALSAYVDNQGHLYFNDNGRIRTVLNGTVITLYGQNPNFGDGGLSTDARFGQLLSVKKRSDSSFITLDVITARFRAFSRGSTISTIAGNDTQGASNQAVDARSTSVLAKQGYSNYSTFGIDANDTLYYNNGSASIQSLSSTLGSKWVTTTGTGTQPYYQPAANGAALSTIKLYILYGGTNVVGSNGSTILYSNFFWDGTTNTGAIFGEADISTSKHYIDIGPSVASNGFSADGTSLTSSNVSVSTSLGPAVEAAFDSLSGSWVTLDYNNQALRTFSRGGSAIGTLATLPYKAKSFTMLAVASEKYVYYCANTDKKIHLYKVSTSADLTLPWPVSSMACTGNQFSYDAAAGSVVFPFIQNGQYGIAELINADPASNGL